MHARLNERRTLSALAASILALTLAACGKDAGPILQELRARSAPPVDPFATDAVAKGARDLATQLGTPVKALSVEISRQRVVFEVQDPHKPGNVDAYELLNGKLLAPKPVQLMGEYKNLEANLFPLADVPLERIPDLVRDTLAALKIDDAKVSNVRIRREFSGLPAELQKTLDRLHREAGLAKEKPELPDGSIVTEVYADSPRARAYAKADGLFKIVRTSVM